MSVDVASLTTQDKTLAAYPDDGLAQFPARLPRSLSLKVFIDPTPTNPAHAIICPKATDSKARQMQKGATVLLAPKAL
jgi:hypothetical protein